MTHFTYFEGRVQSLELSTPQGRATVGVIEPGQYVFTTSSEEHITLVEGRMRVRRNGEGWVELSAGGKFVVPPGESFDIDAPADVAYLCLYR